MNSPSTLTASSSQLAQPQSMSVLAATGRSASCAVKHSARSTTARKTKDPYYMTSPRKRQIQCKFSASAIPKKRNAEASTPSQQSPLRVSAPILTELLTPDDTAIHVKSPPAGSDGDQGGVPRPQGSSCDSQQHSNSKDLVHGKPDVEPAENLKSVSTESSVPRKTRRELIEGQVSE